MSTQAHLEAIKAKHKVLEADLSDAMLHSSSSDREITELQHEKLKLKDEISALETKLRSATSA